MGGWLRALDVLSGLLDMGQRLRRGMPSAPRSGDGGDALSVSAGTGVSGPLEARLAGVLVAALKEAFDRDHARLELERQQLEEQRRRAEEAMRQELRRQALDRELARLRLIGGAALAGWIAAVAIVVVRLGAMSVLSRGLAAAGWLLLLGSLGAAFAAQGRVGRGVADAGQPGDGGVGAMVALWMLIAGLAVSAIALLF
jgi:hypothetical protein